MKISFPALKSETFVNLLGYKEPNLIYLWRWSFWQNLVGLRPEVELSGCDVDEEGDGVDDRVDDGDADVDIHGDSDDDQMPWVVI